MGMAMDGWGWMGNFLITLNFLIRLMDGDGGLAGRRIGQRDVACWGWVGSRERGIGLGSVFLECPRTFWDYSAVPKIRIFSSSHCISYKIINIFLFMVVLITILF
jgi:hypothetical protein